MRIIKILILMLVTANLQAQIFNVDTVINNGPGSNRLNIIYIGDGYTNNDMGKYETDINQLSSAFVEQEPLSLYKNYMNVFRVDVISEESGVSHEQLFEEGGCKSVPIMSVNNYFGSRLDAGSVHRLLAPQYYSKIFEVLISNVPDYDLAFIIANTNYYGGSGGLYPTTSMSYAANEVLVHEFGHGFARLGDEYSYPGSTPRESPNTTQETRRDSIKWNQWIYPTTPIPTPETNDYQNIIGLFEGAAYNPKYWYRPKMNCLMRSNSAPFCEVCAEAILMKLLDLVNPLDNFFPENLKIEASDEEIKFILKLLKPEPNTLKIEWVFDGILLDKNIDSVLIDSKSLTKGKHNLFVSVMDTNLIVKNPNHFTSHISLVEWEINVSPSDVEINSLTNRIKIRAYPNPFTEILTLEYNIEKESKVKLNLVDMEGKKIKLDEGMKSPELQTFILKNSLYSLNQGSYYLNLEINGIIIPIIIVKQ